ncbi:hypothetical protein C8Q76DRAFT_622893 [Earliella scabrosa]|nr:hypothetical protein C8Q76DRAFT_622893 [Earliella scabrosa]
MSFQRPRRLPPARCFAVIRMDPIAMVEHLGDEGARRAAMAMRPKKYLVYLEYPQDLAMPDSEWCRYRVSPIATTLRPAVLRQGIMPDMVIPIAPHTAPCPQRDCVVSTPTFPFTNCYFWLESRMFLRVRVSRTNRYTTDRSYMLDIPQHLAREDGFGEDYARISRFQKDMVQSATHTQVDSSELETTSDTVHDHDSSSPVMDQSCSALVRPPTIKELVSTDLFGWDYNPATQYIPLVDLWLEIDDHLAADSIPSPVELWREQAMMHK